MIIFSEDIAFSFLAIILKLVSSIQNDIFLLLFEKVNVLAARVTGWPVVAKFNNVYFYATIYIHSTSTQDIFIQRLHSFNFNTGYFCSTPKVTLYGTNNE